MHDYYAILGVQPDADLATIKKAYRERAQQCHPDRGGSHEAMVLLNEAWFVLSDPGRRAEYDAARRHNSTAATQEWESRTEEVRSKARGFPSDWATFSMWMDAAMEDVSKATYRGSRGWFPEIDNSVTGKAAIAIGALVGWGLMFGSEFSREKLSSVAGSNPLKAIMAFMAPGAAGAWAGYCLHWIISRIVIRARNRPASEMQCAHRIVPCPKCGQRLRIPGLKEVITATCKSCGEHFDVPPPRDGPAGACPKCGFSYGWDGRVCRHCDQQNKTTRKSQLGAIAGAVLFWGVAIGLLAWVGRGCGEKKESPRPSNSSKHPFFTQPPSSSPTAHGWSETSFRKLAEMYAKAMEASYRKSEDFRQIFTAMDVKVTSVDLKQTDSNLHPLVWEWAIRTTMGNPKAELHLQWEDRVRFGGVNGRLHAVQGTTKVLQRSVPPNFPGEPASPLGVDVEMEPKELQSMNGIIAVMYDSLEEAVRKALLDALKNASTKSAEK